MDKATIIALITSEIEDRTIQMTEDNRPDIQEELDALNTILRSVEQNVRLDIDQVCWIVDLALQPE